jgi:hypothetical protein
MKFVCESLEDILKPKSPERIKQRYKKFPISFKLVELEKEPSKKEFDDFIEELINLNNTNKAFSELTSLLDYYPQLRTQIGEYPKMDKCEEGIDKFLKVYGEAYSNLDGININEEEFDQVIKDIIRDNKNNREHAKNELNVFLKYHPEIVEKIQEGNNKFSDSMDKFNIWLIKNNL